MIEAAPAYLSEAGITKRERLATGAVLALGLAVLFAFLDLGWIPMDAGTLGHAAERTLQGEVPHVDFHTPYSGGLEYIHAAAFNLLGVETISLRYVLFGAFALWAPLATAILRRWVPSVIAAISVVGALGMSVALYPEAMPSWHTVVTGTCALWAAFRFADTERRRWLFFAGLAIGVGALMKLTALHLLAPFALWLPTRGAVSNLASPRRALLLLASVSPMAAAIAYVGGRPTLDTIAAFVLPTALVTSVAVVVIFRGNADNTARPVLAPLATVGLGTFLPIAAFATWYSSIGGLRSLIDGWFVYPFRRLDFVSGEPFSAIYLLVILSVYVIAIRAKAFPDAVRVAVALVAGALLLIPVDAGRTFQFALVVVAFSCTLLALSTLRLLRGRQRQAEEALLPVAAACFFALVAYPQFNPVYVLYTVPLMAIAAVGLSGLAAPKLVPWVAGSMVFVASLGLGLASSGRLHAGSPQSNTGGLITLRLERATLRVPAPFEHYGDAIPTISSQAIDGPIWAGPDAPHIYYLAGLPNRTPVLFETLSGFSYATLPELLRNESIELIVVNSGGFSDPPDVSLMSELRANYPESAVFGVLEVRWQEPNPARTGH